jgi:hypothetical protein
VQALDALGAFSKLGSTSLRNAQRALFAQAQGDEFAACAKLTQDALNAADAYLQSNSGEAGARGLALTYARAFAAALLARHAAWSLRAQSDPRPLSALRRFCAHGLNRLQNHSQKEAHSLATDSYA